MEALTLWHLKVSPYNEKARWALDYKRVPHQRRAVMPIRHERVAQKLWGGDTLPALVVDGKAIGDSTRIVEWLEWTHPEPALYPSDTAELARAFELEEFFDEELGPYMRRLVLHHAMGEADLLLGAFVPDLRGVRRRAARAAFPLTRRRVRRDFGIDDHGVAEAFHRIGTAGERFRAELQPSGYLVGDSFTVADLTLASMCAPAAAPRGFQYPQPQRFHPLFAPLRDALARAGLLDWTYRIYELHRGESAEM
jgi:glutathione S-transferase